MTQDNDPWGNNPRNTDSNDMASLLNKIKEALFGQQNSGDNRQPNHPQGGGSGFPLLPKKAILPVAVIALLGWSATGVYILPEGSNGVELAFGKYTETATQPGFNMRWPSPIGSVTKVDIGSINNLTVGGKNTSEGQMLTADENIVEVSLSVQYKIGEAEKYLFNVNQPEIVLREALISSIREVVGASGVDYVLIDGRGEWPAKVRDSLVKTLKGFEVGYDILRVELREAEAPEAVQEAFDDAVKAREDRDRYKLQAEAYQNEQIPLARGQATEITEKALAHKESVIAQATGETSRFKDILKSYRLAPDVTRDRLYIETLQSVYQNVNNIVVATGKDAPVMYLPMGQNAQSAPLPPPTTSETNTTNTTGTTKRVPITSGSYKYNDNTHDSYRSTAPSTKRLTR